MRMENIQWKTFEIDVLPAALFGYSRLPSFGSPYIDRIRLEEKHIAIGFVKDVSNDSYNPPSVIVVGDSSAAEIFSWLKVYAPETSPLSQYARVVSIADWDAFEENTLHKNSMPQRGDSWACLVLGEVLAQGENDVELNSLPLSRAAACFSMAVARTSIVHAHDSAIRTCIDRLKILEADRRFVRRAVMINDLLPIWTIISSQIDDSLDVDTVVEIVVEAARKYGRDYSKLNMGYSLPSLREYPDLLSDSIEDRIVAFKRLASEVMINFGDSPLSSYSSALLAAGVFLVGRGTTHAFLLRPLAKTMPAVFTWFGLIAAMSGPRTWDVSWSRATKGIERLLRAKFDWSDPPTTDICWAEYYWLSNTFKGGEAFSELPKMFPKALSIEVVPGAACQFRLSSAQGGNSYEAEQKQSSEMMQLNVELQAALTQFVNLSMKAKHLLEKQGGQALPVQQSLGIGDTERPNSKSPRSKRVTKAKYY